MTLKRSGFKRKLPPRTLSTAAIFARQVAAGEREAAPARSTMTSCSAMSVSVAKEQPIEHEGYRRLVASFPCINCGIHGLSQCAHANTGKGTGLKTSDLDTFPLCADSPGRRGCHPQFDQNALYSKAARRLIEPTWINDTQRRIQAMGAWPKGLPQP